MDTLHYETLCLEKQDYRIAYLVGELFPFFKKRKQNKTKNFPVHYDIIPYKGRDRLLCTYNIMNLYEI